MMGIKQRKSEKNRDPNRDPDHVQVLDRNLVPDRDPDLNLTVIHHLDRGLVLSQEAGLVIIGKKENELIHYLTSSIVLAPKPIINSLSLNIHSFTGIDHTQIVYHILAHFINHMHFTIIYAAYRGERTMSFSVSGFHIIASHGKMHHQFIMYHES